jgi:peptidoglycan/xylan/chitin deacetylase (PgdA/CDA1 family)
MKMVLNLIVKDTDDFTRTPNDDIDYSHITWAQLNEMLRTGLAEVQNHSYGLHEVKNGRYGCIRKEGETLSSFEHVVKNDLLKAQSAIFSETGRVPSTFAYPFGRYNQETDDILRKLGFQATLSCRYGINTLTRSKTAEIYRLKRLCRAHGMPIGTLVDEAIKTRL